MSISGTEKQHRIDEIKLELARGGESFWDKLFRYSQDTTRFTELMQLSSLRRAAVRRGFILPPGKVKKNLRVAMLSGFTHQPLNELFEHFLLSMGYSIQLFEGNYDNYQNEIRDPNSPLYTFAPEVVCLIPSWKHVQPNRPLTAPLSSHREGVEEAVSELRSLCSQLTERGVKNVILANFSLPSGEDFGSYRAKTMVSEWTYRKAVNLELGLSLPPGVCLCDMEFLSARIGTDQSNDRKSWFESKQLGSSQFLAASARELAHVVSLAQRASKKVLVLDLDNTLWGGVIGDDGLSGVEIGDTSPRGEAFKAFQRYLRSLKDRGVLLAVCSKNEEAIAKEPFEKHPEMVLRLADFVAFKANWQPKSENIRQIAQELNLGTDSLVFVDDNPAEVEIVRQFIPEVETILLGSDPSLYIDEVQRSRWFEPLTLTQEDVSRTEMYQVDKARREMASGATDMTAYLRSLEMKAQFNPFNEIDLPRIGQLVNKSNQFNLTTRRRQESELRALMNAEGNVCRSLRLSDKFGDHGLVSVIIGNVSGGTLHIDTWLMSCRVLQRQVEDVVLNELVLLARARGCLRISAEYLPTPKNALVDRLLPRLGFESAGHSPEGGQNYLLELRSWQNIETQIEVQRHDAKRRDHSLTQSDLEPDFR